MEIINVKINYDRGDGKQLIEVRGAKNVNRIRRKRKSKKI